MREWIQQKKDENYGVMMGHIKEDETGGERQKQNKINTEKGFEGEEVV
jgi:hypothetical protein